MRLILSLLILQLSFLSSAQESFPQSWVGTWSGNLEIYNWSGLQQEVPMQLYITQIDSNSYTWKIHYGDPTDEKGIRAYTLHTADKNRGHYIIDENNGILIDAYYIDGELLSTFEVMGNLLSSVYQKAGEQLQYDIYFGSSTYTSTGDTIIGQDTIPEVRIYPHHGRQKATLSRIK